MFKLTSVPSATGGSVTTWGEFSTLRDCTVAARGIQQASPRERWFAAEVVGQHLGRRYLINLHEPEFQLDEGVDIEIPLPAPGGQRRCVWLSEVLPLIVAFDEERRSGRLVLPRSSRAPA